MSILRFDDLLDAKSCCSSNHYSPLCPSSCFSSSLPRHHFQDHQGNFQQQQGQGVSRVGESEISNTEREYKIRLALQFYQPSEVTLTVAANSLTVDAKHAQKEDNHGSVVRTFQRTYKLPEDLETKSITSTMDPQGSLIIKIQKKPQENSKEISIPINFK
ncbi:heat shock protein Hsp-12.2-like [Physella acuta]|uniref:heat shock protein Hsp-12.2-like n=1 Tax=Physella acuta TaxID=109671 RepID=UPI0027DC2793|nr:heat shock protein Hsp-12.2-like [Physella acuta]XP_059170645.1 heat shock protein Hsp-12.2-like [Physella acuta]